MDVEKLGIAGAFSFTPPVYKDHRGLFTTPFEGAAFEGASGRPLFTVGQISHNVSAAGVLRGIHFTATPPGKAKYVYCPHGRVRDFLVDLRLGSPTFGRWVENDLSGENARAVHIPVGVGHAFLACEEGSVIVYVMPGRYVAVDELSVSPFDPEIGLPVGDVDAGLLSERDVSAPSLGEASERGLLADFQLCRDREGVL
ncbi:dTDP-4-dehydrorhamnose 3,5-epimerase family protein [Streptomyces radicis]|uniref:dTDP-4-keto-6-deoxy-D-glucose epimerase n=1 Tax=Streptomyces radicis TaxID=1750517 RepID=A0A3A9W6Z4_9ACTN|nr:dTDP-4-dehydrorhamnose 3,5-epimerase family protein [Streptomyces radicis]RKN03266.1 dTDP-4-keto-6-deoxy-D-glucose epimerase [Streptomyces radicis]RKN13142.1 dTDP-4-keto-6-deoxy-D-glucose epimerase [Streptomyces radicis]